MADRIITAEAVIRARDDGASDVIARVAGTIDKVAKAAAHSTEVRGMADAVAGLAREMAVVDKAASAEAGLKRMQANAAEAAANVDRLKAAMAGVATPTREMTTALRAAETASEKAAAAAARQAATVKEAQGALTGLSRPIGELVAEQERLARATQDATRGLEIQMTAERKAAEAARALGGAEHRAGAIHGGHGGHGSGLDVGGGVAGFLAGHSVLSAAEGALDTYREFDKERRYGRVVMGLTDEEQKPLVDQAIHGGATSKFNDVQWLESQRELAARGYAKDQVLAFTPVAAQLGQAFDKSMPEGVKALEGAMLGFGKDVSTFAKATENANRTADLQVKASKISGMSYEDVTQLYKYGAAPAKMAHLSEEALLAFGGIAKKNNMGGDDSGVAFRALAKNLLTPTHEAQLAMQAAGIDFSKYQHAPDHLDTAGFVATVAKEFGVKLDAETTGKVDKLFHDKAIIGDAAAFMPAIRELLSDSLGGDDAKSKTKIAQKARAYRDASMESVDTNGLMATMMEAISKNPALANAIFGSKQGGRIFAALGDPKLFAHMMDELQNHSQGFAGHVADERMAGFDGALSKLTGSLKNLQTAFGRAFDDGGNGGFLTAATEGAGHFVRALAEADPHLLQLGAAATGLVGLWGSAKLVGLFSGGFGLSSAAGQLELAALHLQHVGGLPGGGGVPGSVYGKAGKGGIAAEGALTTAEFLTASIPEIATASAAVIALIGAAAVVELVKKSHEAQEPGHGGQDAPPTPATEPLDRERLKDQEDEARELRRQIAEEQFKSKLPPGEESPNMLALRQRLAQIEGQARTLRDRLDNLYVTPDREAALGKAMGERFGPLRSFGPDAGDLPPGWRAPGPHWGREVFGPTMPNLPDTDRADRARASDLANARGRTVHGEDGNALHRHDDELSPLYRSGLREVARTGAAPIPVQIVGGQPAPVLPAPAAPAPEPVAPYVDREAERGRAMMELQAPVEKLKDDFGLTGFVLGQLDQNAGAAGGSLSTLGNNVQASVQALGSLAASAGNAASALAGAAQSSAAAAGRIVAASLRGGAPHPAFTSPALSHGPGAAAPAGHAITAKLDKVTDKLDRVASAVERGGLVRHELSLPKGMTAKRTYQRGSVGSTIA